MGLNYWPRHSGPLMWRKWDAERVKQELQQMKGWGLNTCRSFLYWPDFMPTPDAVSEIMLKRFDAFLDMCQETEMYTIPTFIVGHMSGENWDVPWRQNRSIYSDPWLLERQAFYIKTVVRRVDGHPAIIGWLLTNEVPVYADPEPVDAVTHWIATLTATIRAINPNMPISPGDGVWTSDIYGVDAGFCLREQAHLSDFIGPHFYHEEDDPLRHSLTPAFVVKMAQGFGKPVLVEEFGCSNSYASEAHQADYYRTTLNSTFLAGSVGVLGWCYADFELYGQRPYAHSVHEFSFGAVRSDGSEKPVVTELSDFANVIRRMCPATGLFPHPETDPVQILVPSYYVSNFPFRTADKSLTYKTLLQSFIACKQAHLNPTFLREPLVPVHDPHAPIESDARIAIPQETQLLFCPATHMLTAPAWLAIRDFARQGGSVYVSYQAEMWLLESAQFGSEHLFGARHQLRFGLVDVPDSEPIELHATTDFGGMTAGDSFTFNRPAYRRELAFCPVEVTTAQVLLADDAGRPALIRNQVGAGWVYFCLYPLEILTALTPNACEDDPTHRIYAAVGQAAGVEPPVPASNPLVEIGRVRFDANRYWLWTINHAWHSVDNRIDVTASTVRDVRTGETIDSRPIRQVLGSKQVQIFEIRD